MVSAEDAVQIYHRLADSGIKVWLCGGWGIDALLGEQTRLHKDLDLLVILEDARRLREILSQDGYTLKELWFENRWVPDGFGVETATAFVLQDGGGREIDVHALRIDEAGNGVPAFKFDGDFYLLQTDFNCEGTIAKQSVACIPYERQEQAHQGYELPVMHAQDLENLRSKYGGS